MADALSPAMTVRDLQNGYWYLDQLKNFAERICIPVRRSCEKKNSKSPSWRSSARRKRALPTKRSLRVHYATAGMKDVENYTSNCETKDFIVEQARVMATAVR